MVRVGAYTFGPFRLDLQAHRLLRDGVPVDLSGHLVDVLAFLVAHEGELVERERLLDALWPGVFVTDNTVSRAISDLRRALQDPPRDARFIQTVARRGYRFVAPVTREPDTQPPAPPERAHDAEAPHPSPGARPEDPGWRALRDLVAAIPDLEAFGLARLPDVRTRLRQAVADLPGYAPVHVALASAGALAFEASRTSAPDREALEEALAHARRGCALDPGLAEAWATLAFVCTLGGVDAEDARAAARQAARLEPGSWRHHFRLAFAAWGDERLRAVSRTLALMPGMPFACLVGAMVHVARGAGQAALDLLEHASPAVAPVGDEPARLPAAGLDWLRGAILGGSPDAASRTSARVYTDREILAHTPDRLYATEYAVNAWDWQAGWWRRDGDLAAAAGALGRALHLNPQHARSAVALAGIAAATGQPDAVALAARAADRVAALRVSGREGEAVTCEALGAVLRGAPDQALRLLDAMLARAPAGHVGWTIPIDPWLADLHGTPGYAGVLHRLARRAV